MHLIAVIPAHDEALTIRDVVMQTMAHVDGVIVIDDGSTDGTVAALSGLEVTLVSDGVNRGKGPRLVEGLATAVGAGATHILTLDADGQHDPESIPAFREAALATPGALVVGDRSGDMANMPTDRVRSIRFGNFFIGWACGQKLNDAQCGMRIYPAAFVGAMKMPRAMQRGFVFETAALFHAAEAGIPLSSVPIAARYDGFQHRPSHFRPIADFAAIAGAVLMFLLTRGLHLRGLLRSVGLSNPR